MEQAITRKKKVLLLNLLLGALLLKDAIVMVSGATFNGAPLPVSKDGFNGKLPGLVSFPGSWAPHQEKAKKASG